MIKVKKYLLSRNNKDYKWTEAFKSYEDYKKYIVKGIQSKEILTKIKDFYGIKELTPIVFDDNDPLIGKTIATCNAIDEPKWIKRFKFNIPHNLNVYITSEDSHVDENFNLVIEVKIRCVFDNMRIVTKAGVDPDKELEYKNMYMTIIL